MVSADDKRFDRWVSASVAVGGVEQYQSFMTGTVQGLGRLDCQLIDRDKAFFQLPERDRESIPICMELTDRITLSYLWVLGAYEIVRTLDQRVGEKTFIVSPMVASKITQVKFLFERVRVPLAKFESSRRNRSDSPIAFPTLHSIHGIAWAIADGVVVSRRQLADALLSLLMELRLDRENP